MGILVLGVFLLVGAFVKVAPGSLSPLVGADVEEVTGEAEGVSSGVQSVGCSVGAVNDVGVRVYAARSPQSAQSLPYGQAEDTDPRPPSYYISFESC